MNDILEFVGDFIKFLVALAIIIGILAAICGIGVALFGGGDDIDASAEFRARCESVQGVATSSSCYKDGEVVFNK